MQRLRRALHPLAAFLLPAGLFLLVCAFAQIHPFGDKTLLISDMRNQYAAFLGYMQAMLAEGNNLFYTLSSTLGSNAFGLFSTYLMSPVNLLAFLFPRGMLADAVLCILTVKIGLIGLSGWWCLRRIGYRNPLALVLSSSFALCGYVAGFFYNFMWLDALALAPLITLGLYRLVTEQKFLLYSLSLAAALICNYYTGYMLCIFSVLLFVGFSLVKPVESARWWGRCFIRFALASLLAAGLAAIVLVPTFLSLSGTKSTFDPANFAFTAKFALPHLLLMFMTGSHSVTAPIGYLPYLFCGTAALALALLYFCNHAIARREKLLAAALLGFFLISFHLSPLNLMWHAFNSPSSFPYRYSFLCILVLMLLAARCAVRLEGVRPSAVLGVAATLSLCFLLINPPTSGGDKLIAKTLTEQYLDVAFVCVCCALLYAAITRPKAKRAVLLLLAVVQLGQLVLNNSLLLSGLQPPDPISAPAFQQIVARGETALHALRERDDDLYRVEAIGATDGVHHNLPMLLSYPGVAHFSSVQSMDAIQLAISLGYSSNQTSTIYPTAHVTDAADALLGVRYIVSDAEMSYKQYPLIEEMDDCLIYENPYALPLAYVASPKVLQGDWPASLTDPFASVNALYAAILGQDDLRIFVQLERGEAALTQMSYELADDAEVYAPLSGDALPSVSFPVTAELDGPVFAALSIRPFSAPGVEAFSDMRMVGTFTSLCGNDTFALGDFAPGEGAALSLLFPPNQGLSLQSAAFYQQDLDAFDQAFEQLSACDSSLEKRSSSHYSGSVDMSEDKSLLLTTLPYDLAWRAHVDGQSVQPVKALGALMAIPMTPGAHTFTLRYVPRGFAAGAALSALSLCVLAAYLLLPTIKARRAQKSVRSA